MNGNPPSRPEPVGGRAGDEDTQVFEDVLKCFVSSAFEGAAGRMQVEAAGTAPGASFASAMVWFAEIVAKRAALDVLPAGKSGRKASLPLTLSAQVFLEPAAGELVAMALIVGEATGAVVIRTEVRDCMGRLLVELTSTHSRAG